MGDSIKQLIEKVIAFRDERNWKQFHNPKDLALSISLEAAELLEVFQWSGSYFSADNAKLEKIREELADVLIYCLTMANDLSFDINSIICEKLELNAQRYPVDKAYGNSKKYKEL